RGQPSTSRVFEELARGARSLLGCDFAAVLLRAEPSRGWAPVAIDDGGAAQGPPHVTPEVRFPAQPETALGRVVKSGLPAWERDLTGAEGPDRGLAKALGVRSLGVLPVICEGVVYAALAVGWERPGVPGTGSDRVPTAVLAEALAEHAGVTLELVVLRTEFEEGGLKAEVSARAEGAEALHRIAAEIAGRSDVARIAGDAVQALLDLYGAQAGAFYLANDDGTIRNLVHSGVSESAVEELNRIFTGRHRRLFQDIRSQVVQLSAGDRRAPLRRFLKDYGIASLVRVPAASGGRVIGSLVLFHSQPRVYRLDELALLEVFAIQVAGGIRLARAYSDLEETHRQREAFLAVISHELRHPVAAISTIADALADTPGLGARERRALDGLRAQAHHLTWMAEEVLQVARLETGMLKARFSRVDLGALVEDLIRQSPDQERVRYRPPQARMVVEADAELVARAFDNLVRNAIKYSPPGSPVAVRVAPEGGMTRLDVTDAGVGLEPEELDKLFRKFGRILNERTAGTTGVGLGLYLTKLLMEAHGGTVTVQSAGAGRGSTFSLLLPRG
ncbi:MAG: GAF domain-containing sensor histidine kinase, partial [Candidatus Dormibacterales bacterium]